MHHARVLRNKNLARVLGLEPRITESKSVVLPLHYTRTKILGGDKWYRSTLLALWGRYTSIYVISPLTNNRIRFAFHSQKWKILFCWMNPKTGTLWRDRTADLLRVREALYRWVNKAKITWCAGGDSNSHAFRHWFLRPAWLPLHHQRMKTTESFFTG